MTLLLLLGRNTDSKKMTRPTNFTGIEHFWTDRDTLLNVVTKTPLELGRELMYLKLTLNPILMIPC